jgi:thimet oligopeptidase
MYRRAAALCLALAPACAPVPAAAPAGPAPAAAPAPPPEAALRERRLLPVLDSATVAASCGQMLADSRDHAAELARLPLASATAETVLEPWDRAAIAREDVLGPVSILANVHPERRVRAAAEACLQETTRFWTELYQDEALYRRVAAVRTGDPVAARLRQDLLDAFEDTGVNPPPAPRGRAAEITQRLTALRQEFDRNLRDDDTRLTFTPEEYRGLPEAYLARVPRDEAGNIVVTLEAPDYVPFMRSAESGEARRRYYVAYLNQGAPRNLEILDEIARLRRELALLHGQPTFAHRVIRRRMAATPEAVHAFLAEVRVAVEEAERAEIEELRRFRAAREGTPPEAARIDRWDVAFYRERVREARYAVDQEALRRYFPSERAVDWTLALSAELYGIRFHESPAPVWHPEVRYFDVTDAATGAYLGGLYVDLYPREGKFGHAAVWPVRRPNELAGRRATSVLVTNFDRRGLTHPELETLLHEMGHALHNLLSRTRYNAHAGTAVEQDFVEAPSQMFEEWARRPETLARMRAVCPECPVLDAAQVERLNAARRFGLGLRYAGQWVLAAFDMALAGAEPADAMTAWRELEEQTPLGHVADTRFPARFAHVAGHYGAAYYGYMWSEVIALDLLSAFGDDLMDPEVGRRFREAVLARGGERPAMEMVEEFLGRPVSSEAFFREVRGERRP